MWTENWYQPNNFATTDKFSSHKPSYLTTDTGSNLEFPQLQKIKCIKCIINNDERRLFSVQKF